MLDLTPYEAMERFASYLSHEKGIVLEAPFYPSKLDEPEATGWLIRDRDGKRVFCSVEQDRSSGKDLWTLKGGSYSLYVDPGPPGDSKRAPLGDVRLGEDNAWDLRIIISEEELEGAFQEMAEVVAGLV